MASKANSPAPSDKNKPNRVESYVAKPVVKMTSTAAIQAQFQIELSRSSLMPSF
jgi:hypothetical protein